MRKKNACPCCGYLTLAHRGEYEICPVCFWEDEWYQQLHPEAVTGANNELSLLQARENYLAFGACGEDMKPYVREPLPEEYPD